MKVKRNEGFTLVELMVAIAILGIISAVAIPSLISWFPEYRLRSASRELYDNLQWARMTAIKSREACYLEFDPADDSKYTVKSGSKTLKTIDLAEYGAGVKLKDQPSKIRFHFNGLAEGSETVGIINADKSYAATVFRSGAVKLEKK